MTDSLDRALEHQVDASFIAMSDDELGEALVELTRQAVRLEELRLRVLHEADARKVGHPQGATSTCAWLAHQTKQTTASVFADLRLAQHLDQEFTLTRAAMAGHLTATGAGGTATTTGTATADPAGAADGAAAAAKPEAAAHAAADAAEGAVADAEPDADPVAGVPVPGVVDTEKARVIIRAVRDLSADHGDLVTGEVRDAAEAHLVDLAARFDAATLRKLGKRLVEVVCPEAADAAEGAKLDAEEAAARRKAYLSLRDNGDGTTSGSFKLPTLHAEVLRKVLDELTSPRAIGQGRIDPVTGKAHSTSTLRGHGFMTLLEHHLNLDTLPGSAGSPFTLVVHVGLDVLQTGLGAAAVETGHRISAAEARRLACQAGIIPMVLGGDSMPLDVGRERRFFTRHQRIAMDHLFGGCAADGCDLPPSRVEYHHNTAPWRKHGKTNLADGLPLCPPHHHMADHPDQWDTRRLPTGAIRFTRRQ